MLCLQVPSQKQEIHAVRLEAPTLEVGVLHFRTPTGSIASIPAMNVEQAREMAADEYRGFGPGDFEQVEGFGADVHEYPDPVDSDRDVNEHDVWCLRYAMSVNSKMDRKRTARRNPTERMVELVLGEWDEASEIPLDDPDALQEVVGIGPSSAGRIVGAAYVNGLIARPKQ